MARFRVGDVVETTWALPEWRHQIGMIGTVVRVVRGSLFVSGITHYCLDVDEHEGCWREDALRLRRPPSWDQWLYDTSCITPDVTLAVSDDGGRTWKEHS